MTQEPTANKPEKEDVLGHLERIEEILNGGHIGLDRLLPREGTPATESAAGVYPALERITDLAVSLRERIQKL